MSTTQVNPSLPLTANRAHMCGDSFVALMYHNIPGQRMAYDDLSPSATSYFVSRDAFAEQMAGLSACGGYCMSWEMLDAFYNTEFRATVASPEDKYGVLLTFDDGWRDAVETGGPVLEKHGFQSLLFITTDFLDREHFLSRRDLSSIDPIVFHIGSHGRTHRMLNLLDECEIRSELSESKRLLEDLVGYQIDSLSIPSGAVDQRVRRIAAECGYRFLFDSEIRINRRGASPLAIGRVPLMQSTSMAAFSRYVRQRVVREQVCRSVLRAPKRVLGLKRYEMIRRQLLGEKQGQRVTHES